MASALEVGFELDRRWHWLRGEMEQSKKPALAALVRVLAQSQVPYAIIGGVALQVRRSDPRTTLDVHVAIAARERIPRDALRAAGFSELGRHPHSENWVGPGGVPVQFTDDPLLASAIAHAEPIELDGTILRIARAEELLHAKLRAAADPARRRSKRIQDLADAYALLEDHPELAATLTPPEREQLDKLG